MFSEMFSVILILCLQIYACELPKNSIDKNLISFFIHKFLVEVWRFSVEFFQKKYGKISIFFDTFTILSFLPVLDWLHRKFTNTCEYFNEKVLFVYHFFAVKKFRKRIFNKPSLYIANLWLLESFMDSFSIILQTWTEKRVWVGNCKQKTLHWLCNLRFSYSPLILLKSFLGKNMIIGSFWFLLKDCLFQIREARRFHFRNHWTVFCVLSR